MKSRSSSTRCGSNGAAINGSSAVVRPPPPQSTTRNGYYDLGKDALARKSFAWIDRVSNPDTQIKAMEVRQSYRMFYPLHQPASLHGFSGQKGFPQPCKKNCKFNPRCYCGKLVFYFELASCTRKQSSIFFFILHSSSVF